MCLVHSRGAPTEALASLGIVVSLLLNCKLGLRLSQEGTVNFVADWGIRCLIVVELESIRYDERVINQVLSHVAG